MTIIEVLTYTASPALLADIGLADEALDYLKKAEGCQRIVRGYAVEEETKAYILITWNSHESYQKMLECDDYPSFQESMKRLLAGPLTSLHVEFDIDTDGALGAPVTEIATISAKPGYTLEEVTAVMKKMQDLTPQYPGAMYDLSIGQIREVPGSILVFVGWASIEAHTESTKTSAFQDLIWKVIPLADIKMNHVELKVC